MSYTNSKKRKRRSFSPKRETASTDFSSVSKGAFRGCLISFLCLIGLSALFSVFCLYHKDPTSITFPIGISLMYVCSAIGGIFASKANSSDKSSALFSGVLCGFLIFVMTGMLSVLLTLVGTNGSGINIPLSLLLRSLCIIFSFLGSMIGCKRKTRRLRRKK